MMWITLKYNVVIDTSDNGRQFLGKNFVNVQRTASKLGHRVIRLPSSWHTCVAWPCDPCSACRERIPDPDNAIQYIILRIW